VKITTKERGMNDEIRCHQCGKTFKTNSGLAWHSDHIHNEKVITKSLTKKDILEQASAEEIIRYISGDEIDKILKLLDRELRKEGTTLEEYIHELL
jgi:hypothetical protein